MSNDNAVQSELNFNELDNLVLKLIIDENENVKAVGKALEDLSGVLKRYAKEHENSVEITNLLKLSIDKELRRNENLSSLLKMTVSILKFQKPESRSAETNSLIEKAEQYLSGAL